VVAAKVALASSKGTDRRCFSRREAAKLGGRSISSVSELRHLCPEKEDSLAALAFHRSITAQVHSMLLDLREGRT